MCNTERNNAWGCPNERVLLYQPARVSNEQKVKRTNYISGNGRKINQGETLTLLHSNTSYGTTTTTATKTTTTIIISGIQTSYKSNLLKLTTATTNYYCCCCYRPRHPRPSSAAASTNATTTTTTADAAPIHKFYCSHRHNRGYGRGI
jgi:hypothetical protein